MVTRCVQTLKVEDGVVVSSLALTLAGVSLGAVVAEPRAFGLTALLALSLLVLTQLSQLRHVETKNPLFFNGSSQKVCTTFARLFLQ